MSTENKSEKADQKAKELVEKFHNRGNHYPETTWGEAKACALICVQELIDSYEKNKELDRALIPVFNFWNEVKQSIQKL